MVLILLAKLASALVAFLLARRVYWEATAGVQRRAFKRQHGCLSPKKRPAIDPFWSLDLIRANINALRQHQVLQWWTEGLTSQNAHTLSNTMLENQVVQTDDPENIKSILATRFDGWRLEKARIKLIEKTLGRGIFSAEGAAWKHSRDMLRPCFERNQVADVSLLEKHTRRLLQLIPADDSTVDLKPLLCQLTLDVSTEFLFGTSTDSLLLAEQDSEPVRKFVEAFEYFLNPINNDNVKRFGWIGIFLPDPRIKREAKIIQEFADNIIEKELATKSSDTSPDSSKPSASRRYIFLDELLSQNIDRKVIRSELLNILAAGRDTTAALLTNVMFELSRQPEILARLRREIISYVGDEAPTYEQLKEMKYLKAIMNESQRLYPIVPINARQAAEDITLPHGGGVDETAPAFVPKGAIVVMNLWSMHRRTEIYGADAAEFNPSRWLDQEAESPLRPGWGYLPFSGGPRVCIGQQFALTETGYVVVRLLQAFPKIESRDSEPWTESLSAVCSSLNGCKVGMK